MTANELLQGKVVDAFINVRSMMEMNRKVIQNYFEVIHNSLRKNGIFSCINRYVKEVINQSNTNEINQMADYPFDAYWFSLYFFPFETQPHFHVLIARREDTKLYTPLKKYLRLLGKIFTLVGNLRH